MTNAKMSWFSVVMYHFILIDMTLALALAGNKPETGESQAAVTKTTANATSTLMTTTTTTTTTTATELPSKVSELGGKHESSEIPTNERETMEKSIPKKRGILENTYRSLPGALGEEGFDGNDESSPEELFSSSRSVLEERPFLTSNDHGNSAFVFDDGYFDNEGRSKRTAEYEGLYNIPQEPEELTPDEVMTLLSLLEGKRLYYTQKQSAWPDYDNTVDSIEADMRDADVYNRDRPGNRFGNSYDDSYDRYPTGMKRFMVTRRRRSNFLGNPKLKVPIFRRALL